MYPPRRDRPKIYYIYEIPYSVRRKLCQILDVDERAWKALAGEIGNSVDDIAHLSLQLLRPGGSPTESLLSRWSHSNATIEMLVSHLMRLGLRRPAELLREYVPATLFGPPVEQISRVERPSIINDDNLPIPSISDGFVPEPEMKKFNQSSDRQKDNNIFEYSLNSKEKNSHWLHDKSGIFVASGNTTSNNVVSLGEAVRSDPQDFYNKSELSREAKFTSLSNVNEGSKPSQVPVMHSSKQAVEHAFDLSVVESCYCTSKPTVEEESPEGVLNYLYADISAATRDFAESNIIGQGGFGVVYRGNMNRTLLAVKQLNKRENPTCCKDFLAELCSLQKFRHKNIIVLYGYSVDGPQICLAYEYMANGSLLDCLECKNNAKPLLWQTRHSILRDTASGLQYLHTFYDKPLIHGDIKSANVLLGRNYEAKLSDFGLAKEATGGLHTGKYTHVTRDKMETVYGSKAYLPVEFFTSGFQFSIKTDIYSFGVVIFETCTGERASDNRREGDQLLRNYMHNLISKDNKAQLLAVRDRRASDWPDDLWFKLLSVGQNCTAYEKRDRPLMNEVLSTLEMLLRGFDFSNGSSEKSFEITHHSQPKENSVNTANVYFPPQIHQDNRISSMNKILSDQESYKKFVSEDDTIYQKLRQIDEDYKDFKPLDEKKRNLDDSLFMSYDARKLGESFENSQGSYSRNITNVVEANNRSGYQPYHLRETQDIYGNPNQFQNIKNEVKDQAKLSVPCTSNQIEPPPVPFSTPIDEKLVYENGQYRLEGNERMPKSSGSEYERNGVGNNNDESASESLMIGTEEIQKIKKKTFSAFPYPRYEDAIIETEEIERLKQKQFPLCMQTIVDALNNDPSINESKTEGDDADTKMWRLKSFERWRSSENNPDMSDNLDQSGSENLTLSQDEERFAKFEMIINKKR